MDKKYLIVPDIHGRDFWEEPVKKILEEGEDTKIIFLGDYLDPYPNEFSSDDYKERAIDNFKKIIKLKKNYPTQIILLLGNHDCGYAISHDICSCRMDYKNSEKISKLFQKNKNLFQLIYEVENNDKKIIFSHAGVSEDFLKFFDNNINNINDAWINNSPKLGYLRLCSFFRGGENSYGSCVWADIHEWHFNKPYGDLNICGHTQVSKRCNIISSVCCVDTKSCHLFNADSMEFERN